MFDQYGALNRFWFEGSQGIWRLFQTYKVGRDYWDTWYNEDTGECMDCDRRVVERMYEEKKIW